MRKIKLSTSDLSNFILFATPSLFALYLHISIQSWLKSTPVAKKDSFSFNIESATHPDPIPISKKLILFLFL